MRDRTEAEIGLSLIRHGAARSNLEFRYLGITDEALSDEGRRALIKRKEQGVYAAPDVLFISPMIRCRQTAEILFPDLKYVCIPEWTEINFGLFEGKNHFELNGNAAYQEWIDSNGTLPFPGGEGRGQFCERIMKGFGKMLDYLGSDMDPKKQEYLKTDVAAVVHGGTIMALCSSLFGGDYFDYQLGCGEGFRCRFRYADNHADILELRRI